MATVHSALSVARDSFLVVRSDVNHLPDLVEVHAVGRCADAMASAYAWATRAIGRRAEVWCGVWQIFDSDRFESLTLKHRCAPQAPGLYMVEIDASDEVSYHLVKRGPGQ